MIRVGITGQSGFVGTHLYNLLGTMPEKFERIPFKDEFFEDENTLQKFVSRCDCIVHLAAVNRAPDQNVLRDTNIKLVRDIVAAMEKVSAKPHVIFSSSIQEELGNPYGESKRIGRELFQQWAKKVGAKFTGCVIPNVFGPYGRPNHNSVVATFCHKLTHNDTPEIIKDGSIKLIYVGDLCAKIIEIIEKGVCDESFAIQWEAEKKVSELLARFMEFKSTYFDRGEIPNFENDFDKKLFTTFLGYIDFKSFYPFKLKKNTDARGSFIEVLRLGNGGQISFSTTVPQITRGNHYHTRKLERFAVIKGKALIEMRKIDSDEKLSFELSGDTPAFVDMPVWYTHNITNIGDDDLYTLFWINEFYDAENPDTFFETV